MPPTELQKPKYSIGDSLYYLVGKKIEYRKVLGIIALYNENGNHYPDGKTYTFKGWVYDFKKITSTGHSWTAETPDWIPESEIYLTKEALIETL